MNYLPGRPPTIDYRTNRPRGGPIVLLSAAAVLTAWYWAPKTLPTSAVKAEPKKAAAPLSEAVSEDLQHHLQSAETALAAAIEGLQRSQTNSRRVIPTLEREGLDLDRGRLQAANAAADGAHKSIEKGFEELEIAKHLLQERTSNK
ncbi:MAG: hypothetical protein C5B51_14800 [Terriglobia bacterium]|nr:MAG: hypothetical protein C5B51_14800 [Terriglobia bacterium]